MSGTQMRLMVFSLMLDNYITYCQAEQGGDMAFDSDMARALLTAFEQIDFDEFPESDTGSVQMVQGQSYLFSLYMPLTSFGGMYESLTPLILPLMDGVKPLAGANLSVLVMNPKTKRAADAVKYIVNYLDNLDDSTAIVLNPNDNEPRPAKDYDQNVKVLEDAIAKQQALLDAAAEENKAAITDGITQLTAQLDDLKAHRYSVTAEQIAYFRDNVSDKLAVCQQSVLYSADEAAQGELNKLIMQYLEGATTQDQFLKEMDKRARMMTLENQ
jgi:hypothetical protein